MFFSSPLTYLLCVFLLSSRVLSAPKQVKWQDIGKHSNSVAPAPYIISICQNATIEQIQIIRNILLTEAAPGSLDEVSNNRTGLVVFFKAVITSAQASAMAKVPGFSAATLNSKLKIEQPLSQTSSLSLTPRQVTARGLPLNLHTRQDKSDFVLQSNADDELKAISHPIGVSFDDLAGFGYATEAGKGVTVYVIDFGINTQHPK
ncbi:hypothetical protein CTA1_2022 [Colletotrichum tanaceti]|uniref:Inhibitor I9 domain-containing protein n=1 Tax=Colletotrichum tanaceti TaxID=1306861 RepID=A0A4U6X8K9_9PEZI|nr:hypothetical protein CTA1_2022 [Colletotrichum tanaceti]